MALREFYKEHYTLEGARKNDLTAALSLPVGILSLILGALVVMAKELHIPLKTAEVFQLVFISLSASACALCAYFVFRSLYGFAYGFVPTAMQLQNYVEQLRTYHVAVGRTEAEARSLADAETLDYLYGEFAKNADRNSTNNDIKSAFLHKCHGAIIAALVFASAAGIAYVHASLSSPQSIQKVEVVNPGTPCHEHPDTRSSGHVVTATASGASAARSRSQA